MHRGARAQGEADEVILALGQPQMIDQLGNVPHQHAGRIGGGVPRRGTRAVNAEIGNDRAEAGRSEPLGMAPFDPVHMRAGKQPVQQDHGATLALCVDC